MRTSLAWMGRGALLVLLGCGPELAESSDECGVEGPVDLLELGSASLVGVERAEEHYVVTATTEEGDARVWAVERCGRSRVQLLAGPATAGPRIAAGGRFVLRCDEDTGVMEVLDPQGVEPPHMLPHPVHGCRIVPLAGGFAVQEKGTGSVWFHSDPAAPHSVPTLVTDRAQLSDEAWSSCFFRFDCEQEHPFGIDIRPAGDELLVVLDDERLLAFSGATQTTRIVDEGPVQSLDVLDGGRLLVVDHHLGPTFVVERQTGKRFEFCCYDDAGPIRQFGPWVVKANWGAPTIPEPPQWTVFRSYHLPSGTLRKIEGREPWTLRGGLTEETIVVDIGGKRHVVWPITGERQPIVMPGDKVWSFPERDGFWAVETGEASETLRHLAGPDEPVEVVARGVQVAFATLEGRIVVHQTAKPGAAGPLWVRLPGGERVDIESEVLQAFGAFFWSEPWPVERDEVVYLVQDADRVVLRRAALP